MSKGKVPARRFQKAATIDGWKCAGTVTHGGYHHHVYISDDEQQWAWRPSSIALPIISGLRISNVGEFNGLHTLFERGIRRVLRRELSSADTSISPAARTA